MVVYIDFDVLIDTENLLLPQATELIACLKQKRIDVYVIGDILKCEDFFNKNPNIPIDGYSQRVDFVGWMQTYDPLPNIIIGLEPPPRVEMFKEAAEFTYFIITHLDGYKEIVDKILEVKS